MLCRSSLNSRWLASNIRKSHATSTFLGAARPGRRPRRVLSRRASHHGDELPCCCLRLLQHLACAGPIGSMPVLVPVVQVQPSCG